MKIKSISIFLLVIALFSVNAIGAAAYNSKYSPNVQDGGQQALVWAKKHKYIVPNNPADEIYDTYGNDPGVGATRVNLTTYGWYGTPIVQDEKSGNFNSVKDIVLWVVLSVIKDTFGKIVIEVANYALSNIDVTQAATAKTMISYSFPTKQGQVWYNNIWNTLFESTNRNTFKHYYAVWWDKNKEVRQRTKDYTTANGYQPVRVESAKHYNDHTYIQNQAYANYLQGKRYTSEEYYQN